MHTNENSVFSRKYWYLAYSELKNVKTLVFAALIIALRIIVKSFRIPLASDLSLTFDCYINSLGALCYGPVVALLSGAVSDTIGAILFPNGAYFFPFIFVEMGSSFIFALFLWRRKITVPRTILSKFLVNLICNIIMTSAFIKWQYYLLGDEKFYTYNIVNGVRIVKNLVLFPLEAVIITLIISAFLPALKSLNLVKEDQNALTFSKKDIILTLCLSAISILIIFIYVFYLKDYIKLHNFKLL